MSSISFDRAAEYYDQTRVTDAATTQAICDLLEEEVAGRGHILEIGVGTGQVALPLSDRGLPLVGVDLSRPMMDKLIDKANGARPFPLVQGNATRLPFADGSIGGAYARWVLHLISDWETAVREAVRVVGPQGAIAIEPGGCSGVFQTLWLRFVDILGDAVVPVGLGPIDRGPVLDAAMQGLGWRQTRVRSVSYAFDTNSSIARFLEDTATKRWSWTWRVPDDDLRTAIGQVQAWAESTYGDLSELLPPEATFWHVYRAR